MNTEERTQLIQEVGEEIITPDDLTELLAHSTDLVAYDGFEPSGKIHIAQGLLRAININKLVKAGVQFKMLVADWHAWANNKMGGDLDKIKVVGEYMIEVWKACGLNTDSVQFIWASDLVKDDAYWKLVMQIARFSTVNRIIRCGQIMGRQESEVMQASQILYPCMQAADIFFLGANICQLGKDQRKVNMLARELATKLGYQKPVIVSHHMLMGLQEPPKTDDAVERALAMKMSKSKPDSAIFMTDSDEDVARKIKKAYCPEGIVEENPILEYCKYIIFERLPKLVIERPEKFGGNLEFSEYAELETVFAAKELHPADLKWGVAKSINTLLEPVRLHFAENEQARILKEKAESLQVTR